MPGLMRVMSFRARRRRERRGWRDLQMSEVAPEPLASFRLRHV